MFSASATTKTTPATQLESTVDRYAPLPADSAKKSNFQLGSSAQFVALSQEGKDKIEKATVAIPGAIGH